MELPKSSLSQVCRAIAEFVGDRLEANKHSMQVLIGNPASAAQVNSKHSINLFFYHIEPSGFCAGAAAGDSWWVRLQCLVTGFGIAEEKISVGENDLRLLGEVMRLFHETPLLPALTVSDETFRLQVVFLPLSADDLHHIWSTQANVSYRPSIVYEMAVAPVIPSVRRLESPLVGRVGSEVRASGEAQTSPFTGEIPAPPVPRSAVDVSLPSWAPAICFVHDGRCARSLAFELGSQAISEFSPHVWIAGVPGCPVTLAWQLWTSSIGWQNVAETSDTTVSDTILDPEKVAGAATRATDLPTELATNGGQAVLYAERNYIRESDNVEITVKSNPLLVTVYKGA